jgi:hypothetical protein
MPLFINNVFYTLCLPPRLRLVVGPFLAAVTICDWNALSRDLRVLLLMRLSIREYF